jgi:hypothetical protein
MYRPASSRPKRALASFIDLAAGITIGLFVFGYPILTLLAACAALLWLASAPRETDAAASSPAP